MGSTARSTWKALERRVADLLGGVRVPVSGRGRGDVPDIQHATWSVEVKLRANLPVLLTGAMAQAKAAAKGLKTPIVVIAGKNRDVRRALVVLELQDFCRLTGSGSELDGAEPGPE